MNLDAYCDELRDRLVVLHGLLTGVSLAVGEPELIARALGRAMRTLQEDPRRAKHDGQVRMLLDGLIMMPPDRSAFSDLDDPEASIGDLAEAAEAPVRRTRDTDRCPAMPLHDDSACARETVMLNGEPRSLPYAVGQGRGDGPW